MTVDRLIADTIEPDKTLVFCTSYADSMDKWNTRYRRWLQAVETSGIRQNQILIVDDGSPVLPGWPGLQVASRPAGADPSSKIVLHHFEHRLGRRALFDFPGWYRSFCYAATYARHHGFTKVIHIESDTYVITDELIGYINAAKEGWIAFWCKRWSIPETCLQVIAGASLQAFFEQAAVPHESMVGRHYEEQLPFTHVEKAFEGDRYGEYLSHVPQTAHYLAQAPDSPEASYFWWLGNQRSRPRGVVQLSSDLQTEADAGVRASARYQLALALEDDGNEDAALDAYLQRTREGFSDDEIHASFLRAAHIMEKQGRPFPDIVQTYERAFEAKPTRAEALHNAARFCFANSANRQGYEIAKRGIDLAEPSDGLLLEPWIYRYGLLDQYSINAYWAGLYRDSLDAGLRALASGHVPHGEHARFVQNARFALEKIGATESPPAQYGAFASLTQDAPMSPLLHPAPRVLLAILAKQKEPVLRLYLECLEALDYPKSSIVLYVRTNNNKDATRDILRAWIDKVSSLYAHIEFDDTDVASPVESFAVHEWNETRFKVLASIRNASLGRTIAHDCAFYFVVDADNFLTPSALRELVVLDLPIVAPMLRHVDTGSQYANYHAAIDAQGYFAPSGIYESILSRRVVGLIEVPVVHCTYLIRADIVPRLRYDDDSGRHEYVIFSHQARLQGIPQFIDNRRDYGVLTLDDDKPDLLAGQLTEIRNSRRSIP